MKGNILIVDDHPGICLLLSEVFSNKRYHVEIAKTGIEALEKVQNKSFDIILLDKHLPTLCGVKVVEQLNEWGCTIPIVFMSGMADKLEEKLNHFSSVIKIISKPFNIFELQRFVEKILLKSEEV